MTRTKKQSEYLDLHKLRTLYLRGSNNGESRRVTLRLTVTPELLTALNQILPYGKGGYGSPFLEVATRFILSLIANEEILVISTKDIGNIVVNKAKLVDNLKVAIKILET